MIKALQTRTHSAYSAIRSRTTGRFHPIVLSYSSQTELKERLQDLEENAGANATVVVLLDESFNGHLPSLIRRKDPGQRIIITSKLGYLPGLVSRRDIAFRAGMLGWDSLSFIHNYEDALEKVRKSISQGERVVVLHPENTEFSLTGTR